MRFRNLLLPIVLAAALPGGCGGPRLISDYDRSTGQVSVTLDSVRFGVLAALRLESAFSEHDLPPPQSARVTATFLHTDFQRVEIFADGQRFAFPRVLFEEHSISIPLEQFATIGQADHVSFRFDSRGKLHRLDPEETELVKRFTSELLFHYERGRIQGPPDPAPAPSGPS